VAALRLGISTRTFFESNMKFFVISTYVAAKSPCNDCRSRLPVKGFFHELLGFLPASKRASFQSLMVPSVCGCSPFCDSIVLNANPFWASASPSDSEDIG